MAHASAAGGKRQTAALRQKIVQIILPRALRLVGNVIAKEARRQCVSPVVRASIKVRVADAEGGKVRGYVETRGRGAFMAPWLEYGTEPHEIALRTKQAMLINGRLTSSAVLHPGARPVRFLRPAFDLKQAEGFAAAQRYVDRAMRQADAAIDDGDAE